MGEDQGLVPNVCSVLPSIQAADFFPVQFSYHFCPFSPEDVADAYWPEAISLRPDILQLLLSVNVRITDRVARTVVEPILDNMALTEMQKRLRALSPSLIPGNEGFRRLVDPTMITPSKINLLKQLEVDVYTSPPSVELISYQIFFSSAGYILAAIEEFGVAAEALDTVKSKVIKLLAFLVNNSEYNTKWFLDRSGSGINNLNISQTATIAACLNMTPESARELLANLAVNVIGFNVKVLITLADQTFFLHGVSSCLSPWFAS
ncbi:Hypothetical predicted protein [Olea europaea subsp. europaea]|uniref:Uncharacterized protein n=1 Tax=Olea europaea subsp. europaea TaxID=158383 RepID=A0A8S0RD09_OLEEU|nr:Hypothetical predicted protein [Olea europaea subsp. europaea]